MQDEVNVITILIALVIFVPDQIISIEQDLLICGAYLYLIFFELGILVYITCNSIVGTYSSSFKDKIGNFYDNLSRSGFNYFNLIDLIKTVRDESKLDIF